MRLINVQTLQLEEFTGSRIHRYAILTHTWEEGNEVTYLDYVANHRTLTRGHDKIAETCRLAKGSGIPYVWVDTCCIDKSSSAELSETINSMFHWYQRAEICCAYLSDLKSGSWDTLTDCRWYVTNDPVLNMLRK
jgi:hypothetical protein